MSNRTYDTLKAIGLVAVPVITFLIALVNIWGFPHSAEIVASLSALDVLIGAIVTVAKNIYDRQEKDIEDDTIY